MEEKELISKLQSLKQIKPRKEWVVLTKNRILGTGNGAYDMPKEAFQNSSLSNVLSLLTGRKLAYSLAVLLFVLIGLVAMPHVLNNGNVSQEPQDVLVAAKNDVKTLKTVSETLREVSDKEADPLVVKKFTSTAKNLTDSVKKNPNIAKNVAVELKTLASLYSADKEEVNKASDDLYKEVNKQLIEDLREATLTQEQQAILTEAVRLYEKGDYLGALENMIVIINGLGLQPDSEVSDSSQTKPVEPGGNSASSETSEAEKSTGTEVKADN